MTHEEFKENEEDLVKVIEEALHKALQEVDCEPYELDWFSNWAKENIPPAEGLPRL